MNHFFHIGGLTLDVSIIVETNFCMRVYAPGVISVVSN
jgi:hypothetical protein